MQPLLVVGNPIKRKKKKAAKKKTRARRKAAPRAMVVKAKTNPRRRRKSRSYTVKARKNPIRKIRARKNPIGSSAVMDVLYTAGYGVAGAVGTGIAYGVVQKYLPASMQSGPASALAKAAVAIGLGLIGDKIVSPQAAEQMAAGALTVIGYQLVAPYVAAAIPTSSGTVSTGLSGMRRRGGMGNRLGAQLTPARALPAPGPRPMGGILKPAMRRGGMGSYNTAGY